MKALKLDLDFEQLKYHRDIYLAQSSLYEFFKLSWPIIEGSNPLIDNWHLQVIAEHLEACYRREIKNLLINVPPRSGKTTLISILFPAWVWLQNPEEKFLYSSYASSLSEEHGEKCLNFLTSNWFQERWGSNFYLTKKAISHLKNNKGGTRIATSIDGIGTGFGGSILIADDPNNVKDGDAIRTSTNRWWTAVWPSRRNNQKRDVRILVQQRSNEGDVSGITLKMDNENDEKEWHRIIIPMEYEENRKFYSVIGDKVFQDPRVEEGELLCESRWGKKEVDVLKRDLGEYEYAAQFQQRPSPQSGGIIKKHWFQWWKEATPPKIEFILQSWDTALTDKATSSYNACTTWGIFYDDNKIENVILLSMWRARVGYPEVREMAKRLYHDYRDNGKEHNPKFSGRPIDLCLIEAKASGEPLIQDLAAAGIRAFPFNPTKFKDKTNRVHLISHLIESGCVWVRANPPHYERLMPEADTFVEACAMFPKGESQDLVDTMSQALNKLKDLKLLLNRNDKRYSPYYEERDIEY